MEKQFSISWKSSKKPSKQRKYRFNAPIHVKKNMLKAHLSKELKEKYERRSFGVKKGDKVRVMRGMHKGKEGTIEKVDRKHETLDITGIDFTKKNGSKGFYPVKISNVMIKEIDLSDKKRKKIVERKQQKATKKDKEN